MSCQSRALLLPERQPKRSVGFSFNSTYEEDFALTGATNYPTLAVRGQTSTEFIANPTLVRMSSQDPTNRDRGNYVMFENVSPDLDGNLILTVTSQSTNVGNTAYFPPVNAIQLVKVNALPPSLTIQKQGTGLTLSWGADAAGFVIESKASLATNVAWGIVLGSPNPHCGRLNVDQYDTQQRAILPA